MNRHRVVYGILTLDVLWIVLSLGASYVLRYSLIQPAPASYWLVAAVGAAVWIVLFRTMRLDGFDVGWRITTLFGRIAVATLLLIACLLSVAYLDERYYSRLLLGYFTVLLFGGFILVRVGAYRFLRRRRGLSSRVVLVGNNRIAREFAFRISRHPEFLYNVVGVLHPLGDKDDTGDSFPVNGVGFSSIQILDVLSKEHVHELIILQHTPGIEFQTFVARCRSNGIRVNVLPQGYELYTSKPRLIDIDGLPLISLETPSTVPLDAGIKRVMDIVLTLVLAFPAVLITCIAATILWRKKGAGIRREVRVGEGGRSFTMYRLDIDRQRGDLYGYERWLRDLSISELPQLWNVLRGDMSLVGPRPESPERVKMYSEWQRQRLKVTPGLTGLAQVNGLREHHTSEEKTRFDLQYLVEWSPVLDLSLLVQTLGTLAKRYVQGSFTAEVIPFPSADAAPARGSRPDPLKELVHADRA